MRITLSRVLNWFIAGTLAILLVPILKVLVDYQTFIHPWRPEVTASVLLAIFLTVAYRDAEFRKFLAGTPPKELQLIVLPCVAFIIWSAASAMWARSTASVLYHTTIWISYLAFYYLFRYYTRSDGSISTWMIGMMVFLWIICVPPLIEYYAFAVGGTFTTITVRYSKYTEIANTIVPLIAAHGLQSKGRVAFFGYATVVLVLLFDIATMSRTGIGIFVIASVSIVLAACVVPSLKPYRSKSLVLGAGLLLVTAVSSAALMLTVGSVPAMDRATASTSTESNNARVFFLDVAAEMWRARPLSGVGADNYGLEFSPYREKYADRAPGDPGLKLADDQLAERTHNEYVQILAELGIVGIAIFAVFVFGIAYAAFYLWKARADISLSTAAALIGVGAFLASSLVTSYSFRIFQNGLVFFFVLAVAIGGTLSRTQSADRPNTGPLRGRIIRFAIAAGIVSSVCLAAYCLVRVAAVHEMLLGAGDQDTAKKEAYFQNAIALDPENATIYRAVALTALSDSDTKTAAEYLRKSIDRGQATTTDYSYLATAQILSDDLPAASAAIDEALKQYPMSTFLRVRQGVILQMMGKTSEAERQFALASALDAAQAATWRVYLESGAARASQFAYDSKGVEVMDLLPKNAIYAIKKERDIRFPEEKTDIPW